MCERCARLALGWGHCAEIPRGMHGHTHSAEPPAAAHGPFTMAFSTSLQACWHLIVQDVPGLGGPAVMLSLLNRASMAPYLRESATCGKLVSLPTSFLLLLFSLLSHPNAASATTAASHIQTPQKRQRLGLACHPQWGTSSQAASQQATPVVTSRPS